MGSIRRIQRAGPFGLAIALWLAAPPAAAGPAGAARALMEKSRALMAGDELSIKPGDWASYRVKFQPGGSSAIPAMESLIKISSPLHVDHDHPLAEGQYWLEFELANPQGPDDQYFCLKVLVEGDPREGQSLKKMYIQAGARRPLEITQRWIDQGAEQNLPCERCDAQACAARGGKVRRGPQKSLYTRAGWVEARSVVISLPGKPGSRRYWFSEQVPMFHIVRATLDEQMELELDSFGQGALSRIDETRAAPMPDPDQLEQQLGGEKP